MDKEVLERFKALGPFKNSIVKTPWDNGVIDAEGIHKESFDRIIKALDFVKSNRSSLIFVLQGEPGSGKSHLLWRIARNAEKKRFLFVNIIPFISVKKFAFSSILESTIESLEKKHPDLRSKPIDHLVGWIIKKGIELTDRRGFRERFVMDAILDENKLPYVAKSTFETLPLKTQNILLEKMGKELMKKYPEFPKYFFTIMLGLENKEEKNATLDLLRSEKIAKKDLLMIGLPDNFIMNESVAFKMLYSLFNFSPFPFILSIDQIETLDRHFSSNEIIKFFENILQIFSHSNNVFFLLSVQTQTFKKWERFLPRDIVSRLSERSTMLPLNIEDAKAIIKKRNEYFWKKLSIKQKDPFFPFKETDIEELYFKGNKNPRNLIKAADYLLETGRVSAKKDTIEEEFPRYVETSSYSHSLLRKELSDTMLKIFENGKILKETQTYAILYLNGTGFVINNSRYSYYSSIKNLSKLIRRGKIKYGVFLRNERLRIRPTAVKTSELIRSFNIRVVYYNDEEGKLFIALSRLLRDTESKDVDLELAAVKKFIWDKLRENLPELFNARRAKSSKGETINRVEKILNSKKAITRTKLMQILNVDSKTLDSILLDLVSKDKIRVVRHSFGEEWIFSGI